jgi:cytochrome c556
MEKDNLEILLEDIRGKFELVLEGHDLLRKEILDTRSELADKISLVDFKVDALSSRVDSVETKLAEQIDAVEAKLTERIDTVESNLTQKLDAVATDLNAHRADTEAHHGFFRVKE